MIDLTRKMQRLEQRINRSATSGYGHFPHRATMWHDEALVTAGNALATIIQASPDHPYATWWYQNAAADGDVFTNGCFLAAGTYTFSVLGRTNNDRGKIDWTIDGESIVAGQDWYSASATSNVVKTTASVSVAFSGWHVVTGTINGKNGSSSAYNMALTKYWFTPSAD